MLARAADAGLAVKSGLMVGLGRDPRRGGRRRSRTSPRSASAPRRSASTSGRARRTCRSRATGRPRSSTRSPRRAAASGSPTCRRRRSRGRATTRATPTPRRSPSRCARGAERATDATHAASRHDGVRGARRLGGAGRHRHRRARGGGHGRWGHDPAVPRRRGQHQRPARHADRADRVHDRVRPRGLPEHVLVPVGVRRRAEGLRPGRPRRSPTPSTTAGSSGSPTCSPVPRPAVLRGLGASPSHRSSCSITRVAAFAGLVDGPGGAVGCFVREPFANVPYRAGGRWWTAIGDFRPMVLRGNQVLVTVTYAWSDGQPRGRARLHRPRRERLHRIELPRGARDRRRPGAVQLRPDGHRTLLRAAGASRRPLQVKTGARPRYGALITR